MRVLEKCNENNLGSICCGVNNGMTPIYFKRNEPEITRDINPHVWNDFKCAKDFVRVKTAHCGDKKGEMCQNVFVSQDPRLQAPDRGGGYLMELDRLPLNGQLRPETIFKDPILDNWGQNYKGYDDIMGGHIKYRIVEDLAHPYHKPNFIGSAFTSGVLYQDPMTATKPQYPRISIPGAGNPMRNSIPISEGCLSFIHDTTYHRENLMADQMRKRNQQKFEARW